MKVYLLRIDSMGGGDDFTSTAYVDPETAQVVAKQKQEEWVSYIPEIYEGEEIKYERVIVNVPKHRKSTDMAPRVFSLNRINGAKAVLEAALDKLDKREREVLGLK